MKEFKCKNCGAPIQPENIVSRLSMARCTHCNSVFTLNNEIKSHSGTKLRPDIPMPDKFSINTRNGAFEISYRWFNIMHIFLLFFSIIWNGFMIAWYAIALSTGTYYMALFGTLHTIVGLGLVYYTLCGFLNRTSIIVNKGRIEIRHSPLPWPGKKELRSDEIQQFYCSEKITHGKSGSSFSYELYAVLYTNQRFRLLKGITEAEHVLYIEQELERYLGIRDMQVSGEINR